MLGRYQRWEHLDPPGADPIIVPALSVCCATHLGDLNPPTRATEFKGPTLQPDDTVAQAQQLQVLPVAVQFQFPGSRTVALRAAKNRQDLTAEAE
jgi:hypothetical protein